MAVFLVSMVSPDFPRLGIDLGKASADRMAINDEEYPVDKAYGKSTKYDEL